MPKDVFFVKIGKSGSPPGGAPWFTSPRYARPGKSNNKVKFNVVIGMQITQHSRDILLINSLINFFNCGRIEKHFLASAVNFIILKLTDITENIIPFFDTYYLIGSKAKDFEDFKKIAKLMTSKAHLNEKGLQEIKQIKSGMNSLRV